MFNNVNIQTKKIKKKDAHGRTERNKGDFMKKVYKLEDLDCANCAAKMECAIAKLDGVNSASVSFIMQKMTVDIDEAREKEILDEIVKVCKKVEPDCRIIR